MRVVRSNSSLLSSQNLKGEQVCSQGGLERSTSSVAGKMMSREACGGGEEERCRYRGVRRRRWGKWVSEIRVPGTRERLWLGSYATPEAAAVAHDTAVYFLRGGAGEGGGGGGGGLVLNFPERAAAAYGAGAGAVAARLSPRSVQRVASDAGMAADAQLVAARESAAAPEPPHRPDRVVAAVARGGATAAPRHDTYAAYAHVGGNPSTSSEQQLVSPEEINVDDMEIFM